MAKSASASKAKSPSRTPRERVAAALRSRFALRFHTSILLLWMFSAGLLTTKALFAMGVQSMFLRYTIAIVVAYGAFLLGVRIWLAYVGAGRGGTGNARRVNNRGTDSSIDLPNFSNSGSSSGGGSSSVFGGGGGTSAGGGASASFDADVAPSSNLLAMDSASLSASSNGGVGVGGDGGILSDVGGKMGDVVGDISGGDDGCLIAFAIMIVVGLIALAIGGAVFVVSMGPEILIDAAFNVVLAGGLIQAGKKVSEPDWFGSVIKATWIPLAIVLAAAWIFTAAAAVLTPKAHTFGEVWRAVWPVLLESL
jgi:hypothetical protein